MNKTTEELLEMFSKGKKKFNLSYKQCKWLLDIARKENKARFDGKSWQVINNTTYYVISPYKSWYEVIAHYYVIAPPNTERQFVSIIERTAMENDKIRFVEPSVRIKESYESNYLIKMQELKFLSLSFSQGGKINRKMLPNLKGLRIQIDKLRHELGLDWFD